MKATKNLCCVFAVFAMVMMTYSTARAQYITQALRGASPVEIAANTTTGFAAVNIFWLRQGSVVDVELHTNPNLRLEIPRRATRVLFIVSGPNNAEGLFRVGQGGISLAEEPLGNTNPTNKTVVFDIVW